MGRPSTDSVQVVDVATETPGDGRLIVTVRVVRCPPFMAPGEISPRATDVPLDIREGLVEWAKVTNA